MYNIGVAYSLVSIVAALHELSVSDTSVRWKEDAFWWQPLSFDQTGMSDLKEGVVQELG